MILDQIQAAAALPQSALIWLGVAAVALLAVFVMRIASMFSILFCLASFVVFCVSLQVALSLTLLVWVNTTTTVAAHYERGYGIELEFGDVRELAKQIDTGRTVELDTGTGGRILFKVVDGRVIPHIEEPPGGWVPAPEL